MTAQLIHGEPWGDYTKSFALGSSALHAWRTMGLARWSHEFLETEPYRDGETGNGCASKECGDYLDALVTGNKPLDKFAVKPAGMKFSTKDGIAWRDARNEEGSTIITADQQVEAKAAYPLVKEALGILSRGSEIRYQATLRGEIAGVQVQTRPDFWIETPESVIIPDLKYVGQIDKFERDLVGSRYEIQVALGVHLARESGITKPIEFWFVLAESGTTMPRVICEEVSPIDVANMIRRLHERCEDIAAVRASENGFVDAVEYRRIDLPGYAVRKLEGGFRG